MSRTETLHNAAEATREYVKGIDRATAIRRLFAFWMAFTIVVSLVPPGVLYLGGPDLSPVGTVSAEVWNPGDRTQTESASLNGDDFAWGENGKHLITVSGNTTYHYKLSEAWNVSTATEQDNVTLQTDADFSNSGVTVKPDGSHLYFAGRNGEVAEYEFGTNWDISTLTYQTGFSAPGYPSSLEIHPDGKKIYVVDANTDVVHQYALATDWSLSSVTDEGSFDFDSQSVAPGGIAFNSTGKGLFMISGQSDENLYKWELPTAYDVTSIATVNVNNWDQDGTDIGFDDTGGRMFQGTITQYSLTDAIVSGTVTYASNGTAVEGASITVNASSASDTTDASGAYSLALNNGTNKITATKGDLTNSITVTVSGSDLTGQDIVLSSETLTLDVPTHMFPNETAAYQVTLEGSDVTDAANVTSSDPTNLTVNEASNELEATSDTSFAGEITITAEHDGLTASRNVTVANLSASNVALMQNAVDMTAAIWGDVQGPDGTRPGGTQLTMRVLFVALLIGAAIATHASGFAGIGGITLIVVMGWFMGWVSDGMALVTVFTGLFIGLNLAANIDYSVRSD